MACPTVRNFNMIDQDQSDNVTSIYLLNANGQTAQMNAANLAALPNAMKLVNGSDNALISDFLDPTLGCTVFTAPDLSQGGTPSTSQALNELSAAKNQTAPIALVPENDEMTLVNNAFSATKTNLYRAQVGQAPISAANNAADSPANYCQNMVNVQTPFLNANQALLATGTSPVPAVGNNLLTFLANRLNMSFTNLNCQNFGLTNPVTVTLDGNGVATAATFNTAQQTATAATAAGTGGPAPRCRRPGTGSGGAATVRVPAPATWTTRPGSSTTRTANRVIPQGAVVPSESWGPPHRHIQGAPRAAQRQRAGSPATGTEQPGTPADQPTGTKPPAGWWQRRSRLAAGIGAAPPSRWSRSALSRRSVACPGPPRPRQSSPARRRRTRCSLRTRTGPGRTTRRTCWNRWRPAWCTSCRPMGSQLG